MRMPWSRSKSDQLELLDAEPEVLSRAQDSDDPRPARRLGSAPSTRSTRPADRGNDGRPLVVALAQLFEGADNPHTEFPESEIEELADDIRQHGILQTIVVHAADAAGRYQIHFGAKRLRAARRAGLDEVPVVVRDAPADAHAQVAENQKRHGLTPLDLARFIRAKVDEGESNATIAKRLGMDPTTLGHHAPWPR
jgi:ParB family chromosome partitioning protein